MNSSDYKVVLVTQSGKRINISPFVASLSWEEQKGEIAQRAYIEVINGTYKGNKIKKKIKLCTRMIIKYRKGKKWVEIMRGIVWSFDDKRESTSKTIILTLYNNLKYLQETEEDYFFPAGSTTKTMCSKIIASCGVKLSYPYKVDVKHGKKVFRGKHPSDALLNTLNFAKKKGNGRYVVYGSKGKCVINNIGYNSNVYVFRTKHVSSVSNRVTLDGIITRVVVRSKASNKKRTVIQAKLNGKINYGIIQRIVYRNSDTSLKEAKKTAQEMLDKDGNPDRTITLKAIDVPEIRKGYKIRIIKVGMLNGYYHVVSVTHDADSKQMTLEVKKA